MKQILLSIFILSIISCGSTEDLLLLNMSQAPDKSFEVSVYYVPTEKPDAFTPHTVKIFGALSNSKETFIQKADIYNADAMLTKNNVRITWNDNNAIITMRGKKQVNKQLQISRDSTGFKAGEITVAN